MYIASSHVGCFLWLCLSAKYSFVPALCEHCARLIDLLTSVTQDTPPRCKHTTMHYALHTMHYAYCIMRYTQCTMHFGPHTMHYALCAEHHVACSIHCALCIIKCAKVPTLCTLCTLYKECTLFSEWMHTLYNVHPFTAK